MVQPEDKVKEPASSQEPTKGKEDDGGEATPSEESSGSVSDA